MLSTLSHDFMLRRHNQNEISLTTSGLHRDQAPHHTSYLHHRFKALLKGVREVDQGSSIEEVLCESGDTQETLL